MKALRNVLAGFIMLTGVVATTAHALPQYQKMYTYYDAEGYEVGWKYVPCGGRTSQGGTITADYSVEEFACSAQPPEFPACIPFEAMFHCW
jgi:hypothetical protein